MNAYRITQAVLTTYSGNKVTVELETEVFDKPLRVVKEKLLDGFIRMQGVCDDPFVRIECRIKPFLEL